jgi:hypothetical protein
MRTGQCKQLRFDSVSSLNKDRNLFPTGYASQEVKDIFENFNRATPPKKKLTTAIIVVAVIVPIIIIQILRVFCYWSWRKRCRGTASPEERAQEQPPDGPGNSTSSTRWRFGGCFQINNTGGGMQLGPLVILKNLHYNGGDRQGYSV